MRDLGPLDQVQLERLPVVLQVEIARETLQVVYGLEIIPIKTCI